MLLKDHDGITHLNYFSDMIFAGGQQSLGSHLFYMPEVNLWLTEARKTIAENIDRFEKEEGRTKVGFDHGYINVHQMRQHRF